MFSEYASRFLQQSNARLSPHAQQDEQRSNSRNPTDRRRIPASGSRYVQRPGMPTPPYLHPSSSQSRFPFASRLSRPDQNAPLFFSAVNEFGDDDAEDQAREAADLYALQRSRQQFGRSHLTESSELEDDAIERPDPPAKKPTAYQDDDIGLYRGGASRISASRPDSGPTSDSSPPSSKGKSRLVDINLNSTIHEEPPESLANLSPSIDPDEPPAPFQTFRTMKSSRFSTLLPQDVDDDSKFELPRPRSPDRESVPPTVILPTQEPPLHDAFWGTTFKITSFAMFAAFILIWFQTSTPTSKTPLGDTIYSALRGSTNMLLWDTLIAVVVALLWLSLLRNYVRPMVFGLLVAVPVILFAFSLYPFISSFRTTMLPTTQDKAMRWLSFVPAVMGVFWTWSVIQNRHSLAHSISILEFSTKILAASPYLIALGFATLAVVVLFSWVWMLMFERIFLSGTFAGARKFVIDANSWWLGAFFVLQYLWSLGVIAGVQRAVTASTVSQWYFHRLAVPQPSSQEVVRASFLHATHALFGTVCLSTFLSLLVRLPLIVLPGRISGLLNLCAYWIIPTGLATLTNPLTLTYAAIHSQPLGIAARGLTQLNFISSTNPSTTLNHRNFNPTGAQSGSALLPYRLSKLLLQATRWIMSFALGFGGWVRAAHLIRIEGAEPGLRGSLYAYVVGLIAGTIGFAVLGAIENVVGAVVDAAVICWASESAGGRGEARFCREAGELFGNETGTAAVGGGNGGRNRVSLA